jgi:Fur family transcriptional regulator, iron response regulator
MAQRCRYVALHGRTAKAPGKVMRQKKTAAVKSLTILERLREAGLRPTRQRMGLAKLLFASGHRHISAEGLFNEAKSHRVNVSLATVYNALNDFTSKGLLREISIDCASSYFDTNIGNHHHFYFERSGHLQDIDEGQVTIAALPQAPGGAEISRVDVIIRVKA